jgi:hypothetical protein
VKTVVEVAIRQALEGRGLAPAAIGLDVTALEVHIGFLPVSPHPGSENKFLIFHEVTAYSSPQNPPTIEVTHRFL